MFLSFKIKNILNTWKTIFQNILLGSEVHDKELTTSSPRFTTQVRINLSSLGFSIVA